MLFYKSLEDYVEGQKAKLEKLVNFNIPERGLVIKVLNSDLEITKSGDIVNYSVTKEVSQLEIDSLGIVGDRHRRLYAETTAREKALYKKGTKVREHRHIFVVSLYDCKVLSEKLGVEVTPELLGANLVIGKEDQKDFSISELPENTHLIIAPENSFETPKPPLATLKHYTKQQGCGVTGNAITHKYPGNDLTKLFVENSKTNRGIVCSIEYPVDQPAIIKPGQVVFFKFPMGVSS